MPKHTAIYIPGLGDTRKGLLWAQCILLKTWWLYGVSTRVFVMDWASEESFDDRFNELLTLIDTLHSESGEVSLVGASAGASTAFLGLMSRSERVVGVVTICGQIYTKEALTGHAASVNPRFKAALARWDALEAGLSPKQRQQVLTLHPKKDAIIPLSQEAMSGATNHEMPISGHLLGIGFGILCEGRRITKFFESLRPVGA